ncbi:MAG TPA: hypothetical protein P5204_06670 [Kiritimatiellia bacterium]|nr:hypothetical protein [Kiritimatiellia bacterium]
MGVTLHYRGTLDHPDRLPDLCDELADVAQAMGWSAVRIDDDYDDPLDARLNHDSSGARIDGNVGLKGVVLTPDDGSESLWFCFDREGQLRSLLGQVLILDGTLKPEESWAFTKTQFSSPERHVWIVGLLRYVQKHYVSNLEVRDEGGYWDTGDLAELRRRMDLINGMIADMTTALSSPRFAALAGQSDEDVVAAIEKLAQDLHKPPADANPPDQPDRR